MRDFSQKTQFRTWLYLIVILLHICYHSASLFYTTRLEYVVETDRVRYILLASVINFFSLKALLYLPWQWLKLAKQAGVRGFVWRPFRGLTNIGIMLGWFRAIDLTFIYEVEQSFQGAKWPWNVIGHPRPLSALIAWVLLPYTLNLRLIKKLLKVTWPGLPVVLYPIKGVYYEGLGAWVKSFQLTQGVADLWGLISFEHLVRAIDDDWLPFPRIVLDLYHLRGQSGWVSQWEDYLYILGKYFAINITSIHIGLGRSENPEINSAWELQCFLEGKFEDCEQGLMLTTLLKAQSEAELTTGPINSIVLEIPPGALGNLRQTVDGHAIIAANIEALIKTIKSA